MTRSFDGDLRRLAQRHGIQSAYKDVAGRRRPASNASLTAALGVLGVPARTSDDIAAALREQRQREVERIVPPVIVAWNGQAAELELILPEDHGHDRVIAHLLFENGEERRSELRLSKLETPTAEPGGAPDAAHRVRILRLPGRLPFGYHRLMLETPWGTRESLVISAPRQAWPPPAESQLRTWGCFLPLYAVRSGRNWGAGNFSDLADLTRWVGRLGGGVLATLPLLPAFLDEPCDPSPYAPVTRLAWSEFYIDLEAIPEIRECAESRMFVDSVAIRGVIERLRQRGFVDYSRLMRLKRHVLDMLSGWFYGAQPTRFADFQKFAAENPAFVDYAEFRAAREKQRSAWPEWPARMRAGRLVAGDYDEAAKRSFLFAQWVAAGQMSDLARTAAQSNTMLYLDLPLGTRRDGYDVWRHRSEYVTRATAGAPPDAVFTNGQDWGFSPLHPEAVRERHYAHVIAYLRHHLQHARMLRMDHVMMLHRLYWIPEGLSPAEGVYVRYHADELYAILALESHRHQALLVGENLGTVPAEVNRSLARHGIRTMHVVQYECESASADLAAAIPATSVASLNTHDMPLFGAWWECQDIPLRSELGLLDDAGAAEERQNRARQKQALLERLRQSGRRVSRRRVGSAHQNPRGAVGTAHPAPTAPEVTRDCLAALAASPAEVVLVNLEDLWDERRPQNVPGTTDELPNWRRKARHTLAEIREMPAVVETLEHIQEIRSGRRADTTGEP